MKKPLCQFLWIHCVICLLTSVGAWANDIVEISQQGRSSSLSHNEARQEIFLSVIEDVSSNLIKELIGEQKFIRNQSLIQSKIIKDSGKYVLFIKGENLHREDNETVMTAVLKLSRENLKKMLLNEGLLYQIDGPPKVLPMISIYDRVNASMYTWWAKPNEHEDSMLKSDLQKFHQHLKELMREKGFFVMAPVVNEFGTKVPTPYQVDRPRKEDILFLAEHFQSAIVLQGQIVIGRDRSLNDVYSLQMKLQALQSGNGRVIAEVIREYKTESGPFRQVTQKKMAEINQPVAQDLMVQIMDAWQRGTFGSSLVRIDIRGDFTYPQYEQIRKSLANVSSIKDVRERFFAREMISFEVDSSKSPQTLTQDLSAVSWSGHKLKVGRVENDRLELSFSR